MLVTASTLEVNDFMVLRFSLRALALGTML